MDLSKLLYLSLVLLIGCTPKKISGFFSFSSLSGVLEITKPDLSDPIPFLSKKEFSLTLTNKGSNQIKDFSFTSLTSEYELVSTTCSELEANQSCTVEFKFTSPGVGTHTSPITISTTTLGQASSLIEEVSITGTSIAATSAPLYPTNGAHWNDYISYGNTTLTVFEQSDTACVAGVNIGFRSCIHGGEKVRVTIPGLTSCDGITANDNLGAFNWDCHEISGQAFIHSLRLKEGKGLSDLISGTSWRTNSVSVYKNSYLAAQTTATTWWSNPISVAPSSVASVQTITDDANNIGRIFVINSSQTGFGYNIQDNKTSLFMEPGVIFSADGTNNCNDADGTTTAVNAVCTISSAGADHLWIEGHFEGTASRIILYSLRHSQLKNIYLSDQNNLNIFNSSSNQFIDIHKSKGGTGFYSAILLGSSDSLGYKITLMGEYQGNYPGIHLTGNNFSLSQSIAYGLEQGGAGTTAISTESNDSILTNILSVNNGGYGGIQIYDGYTGSTILNSTLANNENGISLGNATSNTTIVNALLSNNVDSGLSPSGLNGQTQNIKLYNVAAVDNGNTGILFVGLGNSLHETIVVGGNGGKQCDNNGGASGLIDTTCADTLTDGTNTYTGQISDATLRLRPNSSPFAGPISADDISNQSDISGSSLFDNILDFYNFDSPFRTWSMDTVSPYPHSSFRGSCSTGETTCRVFDWRISNLDSTYYNTSNSLILTNETFVADSTCPAAVNGNKAITDQQATPNTFLLHAIEILLDEVGDDDGLCESNESCIYSPNWGAYQGEGDYLSGETCTFEDGTVVNVKMYSYPTIGI